MNLFTLPLDVMMFELRRSLTVGRLSVWMLLVIFPVAIFTTVNISVRWSIGDEYNAEELIPQFGFVLYFLIPEVACLLGLLLWATPAISTEIEGQTWVYLTLRHRGRRAVLLGKYLTSVVWTFSAALLSVTICCLVIGPIAAFDLWRTLVMLCFLSCVVHAALYVVIGTIFYRRTMVAAAFYTVVVELGISFIPALINKGTINYRLRGLLAQWMEWDEVRSRAEDLFGTESASTHLMVLFGLVVGLLLVALYQVETSEYPTQQEG